MFLFKNFIFSFLSTLGFSVIFNIPKESLLKSALIGAIGWIVYIKFSTPIVGVFFGALIVGVLGEIFARLFKKPATIFIIPGIIPLVPGTGMYYTMYAIIEKNFLEAANIGTETFFIALSISCGIIIPSSLNKLFIGIKRKAA